MQGVKDEAVAWVPVEDVNISKKEWAALKQPVLGNERIVFQPPLIVGKKAEDLSDYLSR